MGVGKGLGAGLGAGLGLGVGVGSGPPACTHSAASSAPAQGGRIGRHGLSRVAGSIQASRATPSPADITTLPCGYKQGRHRTGMRCCWRRPRPPSAGASPDQSEILSCASTCAPLPPLQSVTVTVAFTGHVRPWGVSGGSESESSARMPARGGAEAHRLRGTEAQRGAAAWRCSVSAPRGVQLTGAPRWERRSSACL